MTASFSAAETAVAETFRLASMAPEPGGSRAATDELYELATTCCLDAVHSRDKRQILIDQLTMIEPTWLDPYPTGPSTVGGLAADDGAAAEPPGLISVAYVIGLQLLTPEQRAALLLHDVVGLPPERVGEAVGLGVPALRRSLDAARFTVECHQADWPEPTDLREHTALAASLADQLAADDTDSLARSLAAEVVFLMPAEALTIHGPRGVMAYLIELADGRLSNLRFVDVELNGRRAAAAYRRVDAGSARPFGFLHLDGADRRITRITVFEHRLFASIGLPPVID